MTDTIPKFDPIPRLQQIAATIRDSGADIFDAPATAVHYLECAIKEIERLRKERDRLTAERDDARALFCGLLEAYKRGDGREEANKRGWFCFKEDTND